MFCFKLKFFIIFVLGGLYFYFILGRVNYVVSFVNSSVYVCEGCRLIGILRVRTEGVVRGIERRL